MAPYWLERLDACAKPFWKTLFFLQKKTKQQHNWQFSSVGFVLHCKFHLLSVTLEVSASQLPRWTSTNLEASVSLKDAIITVTAAVSDHDRLANCEGHWEIDFCLQRTLLSPAYKQLVRSSAHFHDSVHPYFNEQHSPTEQRGRCGVAMDTFGSSFCRFIWKSGGSFWLSMRGLGSCSHGWGKGRRFTCTKMHARPVHLCKQRTQTAGDQQTEEACHITLSNMWKW